MLKKTHSPPFEGGVVARSRRRREATVARADGVVARCWMQPPRPLLQKGINILEASKRTRRIGNWTNPAFQNRTPKFQNGRVQFAISAFGFEMQDSSNFRFPFSRWFDASTILMPFKR